MNRRRPNRLRAYDYSQPGAYFVTVCAKDKAPILGRVTVGPTIGRPPEVVLTPCGDAVERAIRGIGEHYPMVQVDAYVIMPNHVHLLLRIEPGEGRAMHGPTVAVVIQQMKGYATKLAGRPLWQYRYHDHVVRGQGDYDRVWEYIHTNPDKWAEDCYYTE